MCRQFPESSANHGAISELRTHDPRLVEAYITSDNPLTFSSQLAPLPPNMSSATNTAAVLHGANDLRITTRPLDPLPAGYAQVKIMATTLCGSDRRSPIVVCQLSSKRH